MGWILNYTDQYGENYPSSYWHVAQCNLHKPSKTGQVVFEAYASKDAVGKRLLASKSYYVTEDLYQKYFLPTLIQPQGIDHIKQCYALSLALLDVDTGTKDAHGNEIRVSFFNGATDFNYGVG